MFSKIRFSSFIFVGKYVLLAWSAKWLPPEQRISYRKQGALADMQGDPGGKFSILQGDSISQCQKKCSYGHVSNSEWYLVGALSICHVHFYPGFE